MRRERRALAGLLAGSVLLLPLFAMAAGKDVKKAAPMIGPQVKTSASAAPQKISPHAKASRERAVAPKAGHRPKLELSVRGARKAGSR